MAPTKRDAILDAAAALFRSEGVHAASMAMIREASGASAGSIYHHFDSKNEIVLAVAQRTLVEPLSALLASVEGTLLSPGDTFRGLVGVVAGGQVQAALIVQLWAASSTDPALYELLRGQVLELRERLFDRLRAWLDREGFDPARAETIARLTVGQTMGLLTQRTLDPDFDYALYVDEGARLLDALVQA